MSVIFPAGTSNKISIASLLGKKAQTDFEEVIETPEVHEPIVEDVEPEIEGIEENPVSDIVEVDNPNPAFDAIRSLPGFEEDVAEIDALESASAPAPAGGIAGNVAKIEDAAMQIADAAKEISQSVNGGEAAPAPVGEEVAVVEIPEGLDKGTEECKVCGDEIPAEVAEKKEEGECCKDEPKKDEPKEEKKDEPKKDEPKEEKKDEPAEKIEKESVEVEASSKVEIKQGATSDGFISVAKLSPENKKLIRTYWKDILGYPPEYVDAMVTDYEK